MILDKTSEKNVRNVLIAVYIHVHAPFMQYILTVEIHAALISMIIIIMVNPVQMNFPGNISKIVGKIYNGQKDD